MLRVRMILLSLLAVFAVSAVAASSASAHRVWTICKEVPGAGKEPPTKYDDHTCSTALKEVKLRKWEDVVLPVGMQEAVNVVSNKTFTLKAGGEEIACEDVALSEGTIENVEVEGKGPTGRDKGTDTFTKCKNVKHSTECKVTEPIVVKGTTVLAETTTEPVKIVEVFLPEGGKELTPAEVTTYETEEAGKAKTVQEEQFVYTTIKQTPIGKATCVAATTVEGDGVAAEIIPQGLSVTKVLKFPATPITPVKLWNGLTINLTLKAFGVGATEVGEATIELANKWAFDVA